jgi:NADH-ubiquinone oxidoreductase chain 5
MGNLTRQIPVTMSCIRIANLALCGFPFLAGFYSKDAIMEFISRGRFNFLIVLLIMLRVGLTSFYSLRFSLAVMIARNVSPGIIFIFEGRNIIKPILNLSFVSVVVGALIRWVLPISCSFYVLPLVLKVLPLCTVILGGLAA